MFELISLFCRGGFGDVRVRGGFEVLDGVELELFTGEGFIKDG